MKLTQENAEGLSLPAGAKGRIFIDDNLPGFGLRMRDGGKRSWIAQYRVGAKQRRVTIGTLENTRADEARKRAKMLLSKVALGADPQIEKAEARVQASTTVRVLVDRYLRERAADRLKPRSLEEVRRHLRTHWSPIAELPARGVQRADVAGQLGKIAKQHGPFAANRARAALSALFSWAIGEGLVDSNPVIGTNKPTEEVKRDRVLRDNELVVVWREAGTGDYAAIVHLLILTGQRREEVGGMLWSEIDIDGAVWRIRAERTKNGLQHDVPLSASALTILRGVERREGRDFVFGAGDGPFQGWSNAESALDARVTASFDRTLPSWRLRDLRRTTTTRMADLGVQPHVVEAVLNHVSGQKSGVAGVYNRASYANEKRRALDLWADYVEAAVGGRTTNVVSIRGSR